MDIAERSNLEAVHPTRLGLALNFSVYYYEVKGQPQNACNLAKKAFDEAIAGLDECNEEQYKEATNILQLMRDNLTLWQAEVEENDKDGTTVEDIF